MRFIFNPALQEFERWLFHLLFDLWYFEYLHKYLFIQDSTGIITPWADNLCVLYLHAQRIYFCVSHVPLLLLYGFTSSGVTKFCNKESKPKLP